MKTKLFFDLDGTLIDSTQRLYRLFQHLVPQSALSYEEYWELKRNREAHYKILGSRFKYSQNELQAFEEAWMPAIEEENWLAYDKPFPGVTEFLNSLNAGYELYLVTARQSAAAAERQVRSFGWDGLFAGILVAKEPGKKAVLISSAATLTNNDWMIGDTEREIEIGKSLGLKTAAVLSGFRSRAVLEKYHPDIIAGMVTDLGFNLTDKMHMDKREEKVRESAGFYDKYLNFDYQLSDFGFQKIRPFFKGGLALEIGPANGYMTKSLVQEFETLHLLEGSEELLNQIPEYANVVKHHSMLEDFDTDLKFDTIVMSHVLEHIADPVNALKSIYRLMKEDGVFTISVPNARSIHRMVAVQMGLLKNEYELNNRDHELGHYRVYDTEILRSHLLEAGFKIVQNGGYFLKPLTNGQIEEYWNDDMIQGFNKVGEYFPENCAEIFAVCHR